MNEQGNVLADFRKDEETMATARIVTKIPGPESARLLARKASALPAGAYHNVPVFIQSAENAVLEDIDGNRFIDFASGIGTINVGHAAGPVVQAVQEQVQRFTHTCFHVTMYEPYIALAEKLNQIVPGEFSKKTYFVNSGAEAVENAVKIARFATGRSAVLAFEQSFHGRTLLGLTLTGKVKPIKKGFGPLASEVYHLPFPDCRDCAGGPTGLCCQAEETALRRLLMTRVDPEQIAAIIFEPVLGEGGVRPFPDEYMRMLFKFARENGILMIADEIQTGWGRTGSLFAMEHYGLAADLTVTAKSLAGGLPLSAVTGRAEVMDSVPPGGIGSTYGGNPLACAAALAAISTIESGKLAERAREIGAVVAKRLDPLAADFSFVGDYRIRGAMIGIDLVRDKNSQAPAPELFGSIQRLCYENGLIILKAGLFGNVIRFLPPLTIEFDVLEEGLEIFAQALQKAAAGHG